MKKARRIFLWSVALGVGAALFFGALSWVFIGWDASGADVFPGGITLRDRAGEVLRVTLGKDDVDCRPTYQAAADDWIVKALVASEDGRYFQHHGVRPFSILRAAWQNVFYRRRISGASTISMQVTRLIRPHPKTLWWKWKEAIHALKMERAKDKLWILSQYLNRAPFGSNFVGVEAAARGWFGHGAKDLGLGEAALLAGMVQAPSRFRPDRHLDKALKRRDYVLGRMLKLGFITEEQMAAAQSVEPVVKSAARPFRAPFFCDYVLSQLPREVRLRGGDFQTSLDADIQELCERGTFAAAQAGGYSTAAVVLDARTGDILAMTCSSDYANATNGQFNLATAMRPAGSTLKPFLTALAFDLGLATPEERILDAPKAYKGYRPANFDAAYRGRVTIREALVLSLNIPFVKLLNRMTPERFATTLRALGFTHVENASTELGLGLAIGNAEVSLLELCRAYRALATPTNGVVSAEAAYLVSDILSGAERSSAALGHVADVVTSRFAWKTGTSSAYRDAWTILWNPEYVVGVWCGHIQGGFGDQKLVGAKAAAPLAWSLARALYPQNNGPWFRVPTNVVTRQICSMTGMKANGDCPEVEMGRAIRGKSAAELCTAHRRDANGKLVTREEKDAALSIIRPEDGAKVELVEGMAQQKVVVRVAGHAEGEKLWWFVNGGLAGETKGLEPFVWGPTAGTNTITCTTVEGATASISVIVTVP